MHVRELPDRSLRNGGMAREELFWLVTFLLAIGTIIFVAAAVGEVSASGFRGVLDEVPGQYVCDAEFLCLLPPSAEQEEGVKAPQVHRLRNWHYRKRRNHNPTRHSPARVVR